MHDFNGTARISVAWGLALLVLTACAAYAPDGTPDGEPAAPNGRGGSGSAPGGSAGGSYSGPDFNVGGSSANGDGQSGSPGLGNGGVCNADSHEGQRIPLDMYFLVDSSLSMDEKIQGGGSRWAAVAGALTQFLQDPQNGESAVGLGYFPVVPPATCQSGDPNCLCLLPPLLCFPLSFSAASCNVDDYAKPTVPLALPPSAAPLISDLQSHQLNGGTPTRPALEGAVKYMTSWAAMHPDRKSVIVLATDGEPTGCDPNKPDDVASVAAEALAGAAKIQTFVIGVGSSLQSLNLVAQAGGTEQAYLLEDSNAATAFTEALEKIRGVASPCDFSIPAQGSKVDPTKVNVKYTPSGSMTPTLLAQTSDGSAASCGPDGGWHYDDPTAPKSIELCPTTCSSLGSGKVSVEFGCQTIVQPPR